MAKELECNPVILTEKEKRYLKENPKYTISADESLRKVGYFLITLTQQTQTMGEQKVTFLIDSGSQCSVIMKEVLERIDYGRIKEKMPIYGIDENSNDLNMIYTTLFYKDIKLEIPFVVYDNDNKAMAYINNLSDLHIDGILGNDVSSRAGFILNYRTRTLQL